MKTKFTLENPMPPIWMMYPHIRQFEKYNSGEPIEYVFFWKPNTEFVDKSCFGQWQHSIFKVDIDTYCCAEQYMMAEKARLFEDNEVCNLIIKSTDPKEMKALGKKVRNFDQELWDKAKYSIVLNGNYFKFTQNNDMRKFLLSTGNKVLVEASPLDTIWGIGLDEDNEKSKNPKKWRGQNLKNFTNTLNHWCNFRRIRRNNKKWK